MIMNYNKSVKYYNMNHLSWLLIRWIKVSQDLPNYFLLCHVIYKAIFKYITTDYNIDQFV